MTKGLVVTLDLGPEQAETVVREELAQVGFGVLTEIDVSSVLRAKLGVDRETLKILGACNPVFAHRALEADPDVALLLPCNVVLQAEDGGTRVSVVDPRSIIEGSGELAGLADEVTNDLKKALDRCEARAARLKELGTA